MKIHGGDVVAVTFLSTSMLPTGGVSKLPLRKTFVLICTFFLTLAPLAWAADEPAPVTRPKIGLVLGGGGARGAAHVGVLKVLEQLHIPVDYVVGTSMGSIVGGLYASGMSPENIEREMSSMDWGDLFKDNPSREDRTFRRKREDDLYTVKYKPGLSDDGDLKLPLAIIRGQKLDLELTRLTLPVAGVENFDQLPIPYRAVAANIETGQEVVLGSGDIARCIRASMAVPGAFDPVEMDGKLLVDGGIANNVPVSVAHAMGADVVIVVDVGSGLFKRDEIKDVVDVTVQLTNFLFTLNTRNQLASLTERDVLIRPALGDIGGGSFDRVGEAMPIGEAAARQMAQSLSRYSLSPEEYARHVASRSVPIKSAPVIDFVRIDNHSKIGDAVIARRISAQPGEPLDVAKLKQDIGNIYGLDIFQTVTYEVVEEDGKRGLVVKAQEKWWGPGYIQPGLEYGNQMGHGSKFNVGALYTRTQINELNGEWRLGAQLGDEPTISTDIYQPLDPLGRFFAAGRIGYETRQVGQFDTTGDKLSLYNLGGFTGEVAGGINIGTWGEVRLGYLRQSGTAELETGQPARDFDFDTGLTYLRLTTDKLDSLYFPRKGYFGKVEMRVSRTGLGADTDFEQFELGYLHAFTWDKNTLMGSFNLGTTLHDGAPLQSQFNGGGFLKLSGLQQDQLSGQEEALARLIYLRQFKESKFLPGYFGGSLEAGNVWQKSGDVSMGDLIYAASLFVGFDTPVGPVYLGYGHTNTGDGSVYIRLGPLVKE